MLGFEVIVRFLSVSEKESQVKGTFGPNSETGTQFYSIVRPACGSWCSAT